MAEPTGNEGVKDAAADLAAVARDRGREQLEGAKGQLAEGAERIAAAVERTSDELDGDGGALSGFGHSVASLMRQLAGGLRERDIDEFARELAALARRNPGVFLAGSVAVGFGVARFFKARAPLAATRGSAHWQDADGWDRSGERDLGEREDFDADESLDLSAGASGKQQPKSKPQRAASGSPPQSSEESGATPTERTDRPSSETAGDSTAAGGTGGAAPRGGKS